MRLRFAGFAHTTGYDGPSGQWSAGDVREVDQAEGVRLLADFPGVFVLAETPSAPPSMTTAAPFRGSVTRGRK